MTGVQTCALPIYSVSCFCVCGLVGGWGFSCVGGCSGCLLGFWFLGLGFFWFLPFVFASCGCVGWGVGSGGSWVWGSFVRLVFILALSVGVGVGCAARLSCGSGVGCAWFFCLLWWGVAGFVSLLVGGVGVGFFLLVVVGVLGVLFSAWHSLVSSVLVWVLVVLSGSGGLGVLGWVGVCFLRLLLLGPGLVLVWVWFCLESLILAQDERWRRA